MQRPRWVIGSACILASLLLTRLAVHLVHAAPGTDPAQIWHMMPSGLKAVVFGAFVLFVYGCRKVIGALRG